MAKLAIFRPQELQKLIGGEIFELKESISSLGNIKFSLKFFISIGKN